MKKLVFGLIATVMFGFVGNAQVTTTDTSNSNRQPSCCGHELCVSIIIVTYCVSWDSLTNPGGAETLSKSNTSKFETFKNTTPVATKGSSSVTISGFSSTLNGTSLSGKRVEVEAGKFTQEGRYIVVNGAITVPLVK